LESKRPIVNDTHTFGNRMKSKTSIKNSNNLFDLPQEPPKTSLSIKNKAKLCCIYKTCKEFIKKDTFDSVDDYEEFKKKVGSSKKATHLMALGSLKRIDDKMFELKPILDELRAINNTVERRDETSHLSKSEEPQLSRKTITSKLQAKQKPKEEKQSTKLLNEDTYTRFKNKMLEVSKKYVINNKDESDEKNYTLMLPERNKVTNTVMEIVINNPKLAEEFIKNHLLNKKLESDIEPVIATVINI
jgi:hypothetical protein